MKSQAPRRSRRGGRRGCRRHRQSGRWCSGRCLSYKRRASVRTLSGLRLNEALIPVSGLFPFAPPALTFTFPFLSAWTSSSTGTWARSLTLVHLLLHRGRICLQLVQLSWFFFFFIWVSSHQHLPLIMRVLSFRHHLLLHEPSLRLRRLRCLLQVSSHSPFPHLHRHPVRFCRHLRTKPSQVVRLATAKTKTKTRLLIEPTRDVALRQRRCPTRPARSSWESPSSSPSPDCMISARPGLC